MTHIACSANSTGNSGGPLIDSGGCLIGINTAIYSPTGANNGVGFAIPVDIVKSSVAQIIAYGKVRTAWLCRKMPYRWYGEVRSGGRAVQTLRMSTGDALRDFGRSLVSHALQLRWWCWTRTWTTLVTPPPGSANAPFSPRGEAGPFPGTCSLLVYKPALSFTHGKCSMQRPSPSPSPSPWCPGDSTCAGHLVRSRPVLGGPGHQG